MDEDWKSLFDEYASKVVKKNDKAKSAYVLTASQRKILESANIYPTDGPTDRTIDIPYLGSSEGTLRVSYYNSLRAGANRQPEPRMGREIIAWVDIDDTLTIGRIGNQIIFVKERSGERIELTANEVGRQAAKSLDPKELMARAKTRAGLPKRRISTRADFVRDPLVVAGALSRSAGKCEMPECERELFKRDDNRPYLEVHHITPLAEGGEDSLINAAALCASCHRELHHGHMRMNKRDILRKETTERMKRLV